MEITVEFAGGMELLFDNKKSVKLTLSKEEFTEGKSALSDLLVWMKNNLLKERPELFLEAGDKSVRPGILVLINGVDWELENFGKYLLKDKDTILFISTLHGG